MIDRTLCGAALLVSAMLFSRCGDRTGPGASPQVQKPVVPEKCAAGFGDIQHGEFHVVPRNPVKRILDGRQVDIRAALTGPANTSKRYISAWEADAGNYFFSIFTYDDEPYYQIGMARGEKQYYRRLRGVLHHNFISWEKTEYGYSLMGEYVCRNGTVSVYKAEFRDKEPYMRVVEGEGADAKY